MDTQAQNDQQSDVDRWIPNYHELGYSHDEAREIARQCEDQQREHPGDEWTDVVARVTQNWPKR